METKIDSIRNRVTPEHLLLLFFLAVAVFMFIEARHYSPRAAGFPRFTAGATIVGVLLLLFRSYLPYPLSVFVEEQGGVFESAIDEEEIEEIEEAIDELDDAETGDDAETVDDAETEIDAETEDEGATETRYVRIGAYEIHGALFTTLATLGFIAVGYLIGLLWAAPLFVGGYLAALGRPRKAVISLSILAFLIGFSFYLLIGIDIDTGLLTDVVMGVTGTNELIGGVRP